MMKLIAILTILSTLSISAYGAGGDIGFGVIKGIKVYNNYSPQYTKIFLAEDATHKSLSVCNGEGRITYQNHSADKTGMNQMLSIALAAHLAGKKVRIHSSNDTGCEISFIAIQETYF